MVEDVPHCQIISDLFRLVEEKEHQTPKQYKRQTHLNIAAQRLKNVAKLR
jgi:hypothetical protein